MSLWPFCARLTDLGLPRSSRAHFIILQLFCRLPRSVFPNLSHNLYKIYVGRTGLLVKGGKGSSGRERVSWLFIFRVTVIFQRLPSPPCGKMCQAGFDVLKNTMLAAGDSRGLGQRGKRCEEEPPARIPKLWD